MRAVGVAESFREDESTLAGVVVRANRVVDGFSFGTCTVGGSDVTSAVERLYDRLGREDVQFVLVSGIALAWYNVLDMHQLSAAVDRPVVSVTYEDSDGLDDAIREAFEGDARDERLATYRAQPARTPVGVNGETVYVRAVGVSTAEARDVVRAFTPEGGRPEPLRVARMAARAGDALRRD